MISPRLLLAPVGGWRQQGGGPKSRWRACKSSACVWREKAPGASSPLLSERKLSFRDIINPGANQHFFQNRVGCGFAIGRLRLEFMGNRIGEHIILPET